MIFFLSGGRASDTKRAKKQTEFIRTDCTKAVIKIELWNDGPEGYKRQVFGDRIIFEKTIPGEHICFKEFIIVPEL